MEYRSYIARRRARFDSISGPVNIPWGTPLGAEEGFILLDGRPICTTTSQNAYDNFSQNDDGQGLERGGLVSSILGRLEKRDTQHQARWNKVWGDAACQKYKRPEHEDFWLWSHDFYNAPIDDLRHIAALIGAPVQP